MPDTPDGRGCAWCCAPATQWTSRRWPACDAHAAIAADLDRKVAASRLAVDQANRECANIPDPGRQVDEWAVDYSAPVGRSWRNGWITCETREDAERTAARHLDGRVMHRLVTPWRPADPIERLRDILTPATDSEGTR